MLPISPRHLQALPAGISQDDVLGTYAGRAARQCGGCEHWFWPHKSDQRWHDKKCHGTLMVTAETRPCLGCGKLRTLTASEWAKDGGYCITCVGANRRVPFEQRLAEYLTQSWRELIRPDLPIACLRYAGTHDKDGYPVISADDHANQIAVHRWVLEQKLGRKLLPAMQACHDCDVRDCVEPSHLYEGTTQRNTKDRDERGRTAVGERAGRSKLTQSQAEDALRRWTANESQPSIAASLGVTPEAIGALVRGESWKMLSRVGVPKQRIRKSATRTFTDDEIRSILDRHARGESSRAIASELSASTTVIWNIVVRRTYREVAWPQVSDRCLTRHESSSRLY